MKRTAGPDLSGVPDLLISPLSRRRFLRSSALATLSAPFFISAGVRAASANGKLCHACIGVGGMGWGDLQNFQQHQKVEIVALCDVDENNLKNAAKALPDARLYRDWRELLEKEADKVDSVNAAVPDHMHFIIAHSAIMRGKHVYCQKPLCHDVSEVRQLAQAAARKRVITQLGTQMASGYGDRATVQLLQAGVIGKVQHVYLSANRPGAVDAYRLKGPRPATGTEPPPELKWDLWLGTAPARPYAPDIYHPVKWRTWLDFGTGWSGDIGCHIFDAVWKGMKMEAPLAVVAEVEEAWKNSPERRADTWPRANHITWTFPGNKLTDGATWTVEWFDGDFWAPEAVRKLYSVQDYPTESAMIVGTEGALLLPLGRGPMLLPEEKFKQVEKPKIAARNHYHHFVDACLGGEKTESHFGQSGPMTEAILLGTVAVRVPGQTLEWNAKGMKFKNSPAAQKFLKRTYRDGWKA
jgi:predicted dehydrogenase